MHARMIQGSFLAPVCVAAQCRLPLPVPAVSLAPVAVIRTGQNEVTLLHDAAQHGEHEKTAKPPVKAAAQRLAYRPLRQRPESHHGITVVRRDLPDGPLNRETDSQLSRFDHAQESDDARNPSVQRELHAVR